MPNMGIALLFGFLVALSMSDGISTAENPFVANVLQVPESLVRHRRNDFGPRIAPSEGDCTCSGVFDCQFDIIHIRLFHRMLTFDIVQLIDDLETWCARERRTVHCWDDRCCSDSVLKRHAEGAERIYQRTCAFKGLLREETACFQGNFTRKMLECSTAVWMDPSEPGTPEYRHVAETFRNCVMSNLENNPHCDRYGAYAHVFNFMMNEILADDNSFLRF